MSEIQDIPQEIACIDKDCLDCPSHVIINGKLDCNYMNRLGVSKIDMKQFISDVKVTPVEAASDTSDYTDDLERQLKQIRAAQEAKKQELLAKQQKQVEVSNIDGGVNNDESRGI